MLLNGRTKDNDVVNRRPQLCGFISKKNKNKKFVLKEKIN